MCFNLKSKVIFIRIFHSLYLRVLSYFNSSHRVLSAESESK